MQRLICVAALAFAALPAWAQESEPRAAQASAARDLIASARAEGVFEVVPDERLVVVRHLRSGLVCRLAPANTNRLGIFANAARGEDVACDTTDGREGVTLYATRFPFRTTLDEQAESAAAAVRETYPDARPYPQSREIASDTLPAHRALEFLVTRPDGARMYTRIAIAFVGAWTIKMRYTVVAPDDAAAQRGATRSTALWAAALAEMDRPRP